MQPCLENNTSFFEKLQDADGLDLRDNRGKRHDLAVVLMGVTLALLSQRDGNLSSIHRHLRNHYRQLMEALKLPAVRPVSRSQLPKILSRVSVGVLDKVLFDSYGVKLSAAQRQWFALDGKELRGSIESGAKRGEVVVQAVSHESREVQSQRFYNGRKHSEVTTVRRLLRENGLENQKISLDALHCKPKTLEPITASGGIYLVGVKGNQKELGEVLSEAAAEQKAVYRVETVEKGHGRIETRQYQVYKVEQVVKAERWAGSQIRTLVKVKRERIAVKSGKQTKETSYYISNEKSQWSGLCQAVRGHWRVETNNQIRDVTLREDELRSKKRG